MKAALTIAMFSHFYYGLDRPLPFWLWYLALFTLSCRIALTQMSSDCSNRLTILFLSHRTTSFKLWHLLVMRKSSSVRHCYSRRKIFAVEKQQNFWSIGWELLLICTCWMSSFDALELLLFIHRTPNFNHFHVRS